MEPISPKHITVTDPFWAPRIRTVADIVLPYQWQVLHDQVPGAPKSSCIANFQKAAHAIAAAKAGGPRPTYPTDKWYYDDKNSQEKAFMGWVFQDSDLYKWLEAAAYAIPYGNRAYLTKRAGKRWRSLPPPKRRTAIWTPCIPSTACKTDLPT